VEHSLSPARCSNAPGPGLHPSNGAIAERLSGRQTSPAPGAALIGRKTLVYGLTFAAIVPAILLAIWVSAYGVNVPYSDEWRMIPLFAKWHDHQLSFADLYQQHNEHRIVIPKLIYLAFATFTHWNLHYEMYFSVALCFATSAAVYTLLRRTFPLNQTKPLLLWIACNVVIFSPVQAENWMWGFQLQLFIPNLCLVLSLVALTLDTNRSIRLVLAAIFTVIGTFSFGNGLLLWPAIGLFMILRRERTSSIILWTVLCAVVATTYFVGYVPAPKRHPVTGGWLDYPTYFLAFLGSPLARDGVLVRSAATGTVVLAFFGGLVGYYLRRNPNTLRRAAPWITIGSYALLSGLLAACTRVHCGPGQACDSRYITISSNLVLALIALFSLVDPAQAGDSKIDNWLRSAKNSALTVIIILALVGLPIGVTYMQRLHRDICAGLAALQFSRVADTKQLLCEQLMIPVEVKRPQDYIATLEKLHLLANSVRTDASLEDADGRPKRATDEFGVTTEVHPSGPQTFEATGWAYLPEREVSAPVVLVTARQDDGWHVFDLQKTGEPRQGVAAKFHSRNYLKSGWSASFDVAKLPPTANVVSAWALDPISAKTYKLPGEFRLPK